MKKMNKAIKIKVTKKHGTQNIYRDENIEKKTENKHNKNQQKLNKQSKHKDKIKITLIKD